MNKKQCGLLLMVSLLAGLVGGIFTNQFLVGTPVLAQKKVGPQNVVIAEEFRLVDKEGKILSTWGMYAGGPEIVLFNKNGQFRAVFSLKPAKSGFPCPLTMTAILIWRSMIRQRMNVRYLEPWT